jgi:hypothetical protein
MHPYEQHQVHRKAFFRREGGFNIVFNEKKQSESLRKALAFKNVLLFIPPHSRG